jgi:pimeloyl-ACP methyl ester carboxylesterase
VCRGLEAGFPKGVRAVMVEGAGHFLHLERPELVAREVLAHLGRPGSV